MYTGKLPLNQWLEGLYNGWGVWLVEGDFWGSMEIVISGKSLLFAYYC